MDPEAKTTKLPGHHLSTGLQRAFQSYASHPYLPRLLTLITTLLMGWVTVSLVYAPSLVIDGDGAGTIGSGISRGGSGLIGYTKLNKRAGTPPMPANPGFISSTPPRRLFWSKELPKVVVVVGANQGGGVDKWKEPREWKTEKASLQDKRAYAKRHGYDFVVKDLTRKKKHSHEHREAWAKWDVIREAMRDHPDAEWFWYVDMNTYIMKPKVALETLVWRHLDTISRDKLDHSQKLFNAADKDKKPYVDLREPVDMIVSQDCQGVNLESFFIRRSEWSEMLFDVMFDPIFYKSLHMKWTRDEASALEYFYDQQAWVRSRVGFMPFRHFNSLAHGCTDVEMPLRFVYNETGNDFLVNMHNCRDRGDRNCHDEMEYYAKLRTQLQLWW